MRTGSRDIDILTLQELREEGLHASRCSFYWATKANEVKFAENREICIDKADYWNRRACTIQRYINHALR